jgi:hypothetical protein
VTLRVDGGGSIGSLLSEREGGPNGLGNIVLESIIDHVLTGILYRQKIGVKDVSIYWANGLSLLSPRAG